MRRGLALALLLSGCLEGRRARLQSDISHLREEVRELQAEADRLQKRLATARPATRAVRMDLDPEGFDASRPLPAGDARHPDVLLLSVDTLRADHLGTYGYSRDTSPFLDGLGAKGTVFERAHAATSWTLPSHTTMLSGLLPHHHGIVDDHLRVADDVPMIQEAFQRAGYGTIGAVATLFVSSRFGFDRGFDAFQDFGVKEKATNNLSTVDADHVFHFALHQAQQQPHGKPLFLFLHVYDVHYGYDAPPPWNEKFDRAPTWGDEPYKKYHLYKSRGLPDQDQMDHQIAQYDEEIAYVDAMFRELVETWRASGRELLVVVTADHGEEFGERGSWGHGHTVWPEQTHVPLIVNGPGVRVQRVSERVGTEDIAPTLAELAGIPFPTGDGSSRATQVRRGGPPPRGASAEVASTSRFDTNVVRFHDAPFDLTLDLTARTRELCRTDTDPRCAQDVFAAQPDEAARAMQRWLAWEGRPWLAKADGEVDVKGGAAFLDGVQMEKRFPVRAGQRFVVVPLEAEVLFRGADGAVRGPWQPAGGSVPGAGCPLGFEGRYLVRANLGGKSEEEVAMLDALGYLGDDDDDDEASTNTGPQPCE